MVNAKARDAASLAHASRWHRALAIQSKIAQCFPDLKLHSLSFTGFSATGVMSEPSDDEQEAGVLVVAKVRMAHSHLQAVRVSHVPGRVSSAIGSTNTKSHVKRSSKSVFEHIIGLHNRRGFAVHCCGGICCLLLLLRAIPGHIQTDLPPIRPKSPSIRPCVSHWIPCLIPTLRCYSRPAYAANGFE